MRAFLGPKYREIHDQSLDITCMTGAAVECRTPVPKVPGSVFSRGAFHCGLEQVTFPHL